MMRDGYAIRDQLRKRSSRAAMRQIAERRKKLASRLRVSGRNEAAPDSRRSLPGGTSRVMLSRLALGELTRRRGMDPADRFRQDVSGTTMHPEGAR